MSWLEYTLLFLIIVLVATLVVVWIYRFAAGARYAKGYWLNFYRDHYQHRLDVDSMSYRQGVADGRVMREFERNKALMQMSERTHEDLTEDDIKRLSNV